MLSIEEIVDRTAFAAPGEGRAMQLIQTAYRQQIADRIGIKPGDRILEIACGQGDMTAVLANLVGPTGRVTAIDIAEPTYGAPVNLGDAMAAITASDLGDRIDVHWQFDLLDPAITFPPNTFDLAVLAHGAWYFDQPSQLEATLRRVGEWTDRLALAEWDMQPTALSQLPHLLAVQIQGYLSALVPQADSNVRTPLSRSEMITLVERAGWAIEAVTSLDTTGLHDADWEITNTNFDLEDLDWSTLPEGPAAFLRSQLDLMNTLTLTTQTPVEPLPSYLLSCFIASRGKSKKVSNR